jgi:hypothetical protein
MTCTDPGTAPVSVAMAFPHPVPDSVCLVGMLSDLRPASAMCGPTKPDACY